MNYQGRGTSSRLSLRANFVWNLAGKVLFSASMWGVIIVLARIGSPEMVGTYALGLAITAPVILFAHLGARPLLASDHTFSHGYRDYLTLRLISLPVALVAVLVVVLLMDLSVGAALAVLAIACYKVVDGISDISYGAMQAAERMHHVAVSVSLRGLLAFATVYVLLSATESVGIAAAGIAVTWLFVLVVHDLPVARRALEVSGLSSARGTWPLTNSVGRQRLKRLFFIALPLGVTAPLLSLQMNIPRYAVEAYVGRSALGVFSALSQLLIVGNVFVMALAQPALPRLKRLAATGRIQEFWRLLGGLALFGAAIGVVGTITSLLIGSYLLRWIYGPEYAAHTTVFVWLALAAIPAFSASFLHEGLVTVGAIRIQPLFYGGNIIVVALLSLLLVPVAGLHGAAWAYGIGMVMQLLGCSILIRAAVNRGKRSGEDVGSYRPF